MLYYATEGFENVTIEGHAAVSIIPGARVIVFGTDYEMVKLAADAYALQHELYVLDNAKHIAYSPKKIDQ